MSKVSVKAFKRAVRYLDNGTDVVRPNGLNSYICLAIAQARGEGEISEEMYWSARCEISKRLDGHSSVECWLRDVAKIPNRMLTRKNLQAYRHAWLQSLIKEFSKNK